MKTRNREKGFSLPTVALLAAFMAGLEYFFIIQLSNSGYRAVSWIVSSCMLVIFIALQRSGNVARYRRIFFVASALLFVPAFIALLIESRGSMTAGAKEIFLNQTPFCHIVIPQAILPYLLKGVLVFPARLTNYFASAYSMIVIWLVASLTIGRGWCSWVCFYGGWDDGASRVMGKPRGGRGQAWIAIRDKDRHIRLFSFAVLAFVVLAGLATLSSVYCAWLCPFKIVTEYAQVVNAATYLSFIVFVILFFAFALILPLLTGKRVQCMSLCPFGAFQSLVDKASLYRIRIDPEKCTKCGECARVCPVMAVDESSTAAGSPKVLLTCTKCGECVTACPKGAARYDFSWSRACGDPKGPIARLRARFTRAGRTHGFAPGLLRTLDELLSPQALMTTSGFTMGMIVTGSFWVSTLARFLHLLLTGSFLMK